MGIEVYRNYDMSTETAEKHCSACTVTNCAQILKIVTTLMQSVNLILIVR